MNLKRFIISIFCFWVLTSFTRTARRRIKFQSEEAIGFANGSVLNSFIGTVADKASDFILGLNKGTRQLQASAIWFAIKILLVDVTDQWEPVEVILSDNT